MWIPKPELIASLREKYPKGTRVELVQMNDLQAPPVGTKGTVIGIDGMASIMVQWDTGSSLSIAYGDDICKKVTDKQL